MATGSGAGATTGVDAMNDSTESVAIGVVSNVVTATGLLRIIGLPAIGSIIGISAIVSVAMGCARVTGA